MSAILWCTRKRNKIVSYDVAIVGAGAAGLAAAQHVLKSGLKVALLEARGRSGGRAVTDTTSFGVPFDRGCGYIHHMPGNPLAGLAKSKGMALVPVKGEKWSQVWCGPREASGKEYDAIESQYKAVEKALGSRAKKKLDQAVSDALADVPHSVWSPMIQTWLEVGCAPAKASLMDWYLAEAGEDYFCTPGLGTLICTLAEGLEIRLNTPVLEIQHSASRCRIITAGGEVTASCVIITVPHAILAAEKIKFTPSLPDWKIKAIDALTAADYAVVGLQFSSGDVLPVPANAWFYPRNEAGDGSLMFINNVAGSGICRAETDGANALALLELGEAGAIAHALDVLAASLGNNIRQKFVKGTITDWHSDPLALGAWSWAKPGRSGERKILAAPIENRLFFAGEACHPQFFATVHGALLSGRDAATEVARHLAA